MYTCVWRLETRLGQVHRALWCSCVRRLALHLGIFHKCKLVKLESLMVISTLHWIKRAHSTGGGRPGYPPAGNAGGHHNHNAAQGTQSNMFALQSHVATLRSHRTPRQEDTVRSIPCVCALAGLFMSMCAYLSCMFKHTCINHARL